MSLPRTGSRRVAVDGDDYIWRIRKKPTYSQALGESPMTLAVQREDGRSVLVVDLGVSRPDSWIVPHQTRVTPHVVRLIVQAALADGWAPESDEGHALSYPLIRDS